MHDNGHTEHGHSARSRQWSILGRMSVSISEEDKADKYRNEANQIHRHIGDDRPKNDEQPQAHSAANEPTELQALPSTARADSLFLAKNREDRIRSGALHLRKFLDGFRPVVDSGLIGAHIGRAGVVLPR